MQNTILIAGGSGLIGSRLVEYIGPDYNFHILSRSKRTSKGNIKYFQWDTQAKTMDTKALEGVTTIINLAGAGIADKRWTDKRKVELLNSRLDSIATLKNAVAQLDAKMPLYIGASAVGYYGNQGDTVMKEDSGPGTGFLADVTAQWEEHNKSIVGYFDREVILRIGIVLSKKGGALKEILKPAAGGMYGYFGDGSAYYSWIHIDDICKMIGDAITDAQYSGTHNATAPEPITIKALVKAVKAAKGGIGLVMPVPTLALKLALGEMTQMLTDSMRAVPARLQAQGHDFIFTDPELAIKDILDRKV